MANEITGTSNVWPNYAKGNKPASEKTGQSSLGKDDFLKLLVTQLQYQDPMQPLEDKEFIAQMAQFSSVEQIMNMSTELKQLRQSMGLVSGLIGKSVSWTVDSDKGEPEVKSGIVQSIKYKDGSQYVVVEGDEVPLDDITSISAAEGGE